MSLNKELVEKNFDYIEEAIKVNNREFFVALFLYDVVGVEKDEITEDIIKYVHNVLDETEHYYDENLRDNILRAKTDKLIQQLEFLVDNYIEKCTTEEWEELLDEYNILDVENYMGEVRENLEEAITEDYRSSDNEEKQKIINRLSKYITKEKEYDEPEEDIEK